MLVKRLALRNSTVTPELADAIDRLNKAVIALAEVIDELGGGAYYSRPDALDDLARQRILYRGTGARPM